MRVKDGYAVLVGVGHVEPAGFGAQADAAGLLPDADVFDEAPVLQVDHGHGIGALVDYIGLGLHSHHIRGLGSHGDGGQHRVVGAVDERHRGGAVVGHHHDGAFGGLRHGYGV